MSHSETDSNDRLVENLKQSYWTEMAPTRLIHVFPVQLDDRALIAAAIAVMNNPTAVVRHFDFSHVTNVTASAVGRFALANALMCSVPGRDRIINASTICRVVVESIASQVHEADHFCMPLFETAA
ncbi:MAG: hypothetical protein HWE20_06940 [Gammaproteobacteria bacterium]|nr:hypothetical protein [Gammaproteobacteria bacterium]